MKVPLSLLLSLTLVVGMSCAAPQKRQPYNGEDRVGAVQPTMLIGQWRHKILNPMPGENESVVTSTYHADGRLISYAEHDAMQGAAGSLTAFKLEMTGTWAPDGEVFVFKGESLNEVSGNKLAGMMTGIMRDSFQKRFNSRVNVYFASREKLIMVSNHGQAQELTRIE